MRKQRAAAALALALLLLLCPARARAQEAPQGSWRAAALVEQSTGRVLYAENGDEELPMASTTKIMTALCAVESGRLGETVEIDRRMVGIEGSSIYLEAGERLTVEELTYGLMLRSGNDAAAALASALSGRAAGFQPIQQLGGIGGWTIVKGECNELCARICRLRRGGARCRGRSNCCGTWGKHSGQQCKRQQQGIYSFFHIALPFLNRGCLIFLLYSIILGSSTGTVAAFALHARAATVVWKGRCSVFRIRSKRRGYARGRRCALHHP